MQKKDKSHKRAGKHRRDQTRTIKGRTGNETQVLKSRSNKKKGLGKAETGSKEWENVRDIRLSN